MQTHSPHPPLPIPPRHLPRKQHIRKLRLPIPRPRRRALQIDIIKHNPGSRSKLRVAVAGDGYDSYGYGGRGGQGGGGEEGREQEAR
jgi:hypothetical protein